MLVFLYVHWYELIEDDLDEYTMVSPELYICIYHKWRPYLAIWVHLPYNRTTMPGYYALSNNHACLSILPVTRRRYVRGKQINRRWQFGKVVNNDIMGIRRITMQG